MTTNQPKSSVTESNHPRGSASLTWDEATFTWNEATGTWDNPYTATNQNKSSVTIAMQAKS